MWSKTNVDYLTSWVSGLRDKKGLNITAIAVAWNERSYDATFIKAMRKSLDAAGLSHVKTIAPDSWGAMWKIVPDMQLSALTRSAREQHDRCLHKARSI